MAELVLVCRASGDGVARDPCGTIAGVPHQPEVITGYVLSEAEGNAFAAWSPPIDWAAVGAYFAAALSLVLTIWFVAYCVGAVLKAARSA